MAAEIRGVAASGTLYARLMNRAGQIFNSATEAFEAYSAGNYTSYDIALTEQGNSGVYVADFPTAIQTGGTYEYFVHRQTGGTPAEGDPVVNTGKVDWTGTAAITASAGSLSGSEFRSYLLGTKGFKRTDKDTELYEAITDAIQIMRRDFEFDEAETEAESTDQIDTLGQFKLDIESDLGLLLGVILEDDDTGTPLVRVNKSQFDELYPSINVESDRGYPRHYCVYAGQVYIGPRPDSVAYNYRLSYSKRAGTITSSTTGVPFTNLYRDVLGDLVMSLLWEGLEEHDKADRARALYDRELEKVKRRERRNAGNAGFAMRAIDC